MKKKTIVRLGSVVLLLGLTQFAVAEEPETAASLTRNLSLSAEQSSKASQILAAQDASCKKYTEETQQRNCRLMAKQQAEFQIDSMLTADQKPKYAKMRQDKIEQLRATRVAPQ